MLDYGNSSLTSLGLQGMTPNTSSTLQAEGATYTYRQKELPKHTVGGYLVEAESVNCWKSTVVILEAVSSLPILQYEIEFTLKIAYHFVL